MNTEFNIEQGGLGDKAGLAINNALKLTSEQGIMNSVDNAEAFAKMAGQMATEAPEKIIEFIIQQLLSATKAGEALLTGVNAAQNIIVLLKNALNIAMTAGSYAANIKLLALNLCQTGDADIVCNPSVKDSTYKLGQSLKSILIALYDSAKLQILDLYNSMICTSNDAVIDNAMASINKILDIVEPLLNPLVFKYTGYSISEIRSICHQGFQMISMLKRVSLVNKIAALKSKDELNNTANNISNLANSTANSMANSAKYSANNIGNNVKGQASEIGNAAKDTANLVSEEAKAKATAAKEKAKEEWQKKTKDLSKDEVKAKLMSWLKSQSFILQNAFEILVIKDTINDIKDGCMKMQNMSAENMADLANTVLAILDLFEIIGISKNAKGLTASDLEQLGIGAVGSLKNTANLVTSSAQNIVSNTQDNLQNTANLISNNVSQQVDNAVDAGNSIVNNAADLLNNINSTADLIANLAISNAKDTANNVKNNASSIAEQTADNVKNQVSTQNILDNLNLIINLQNNSLQNVSKQSKEIFTYDITQNEQDTNVKIVLLQYPLQDSQVMNFLTNTFVYNNKQIFTNGAKRSILNKLIDAWNDNKSTTFKISGKVDKVIRKYEFNVSIEKNSNVTSTENTSTAESILNNSTNSASSLINNASSSIAGQASNITSGATLATSGAINSLATNANNASNSVMSNASNLTNNTLDSATNLAGSTYDQVSQSISNISVGLDATLFATILNGKVMMFDEVVQLLKVFMPIVTALKFIMHLLENYKINKEYVRTKLHKDLLSALRDAAQLILGLGKKLSLATTNFYTIRTKNSYEWCKNNLTIYIDKANMCTIDALLTMKLNSYVKENGLPKIAAINILLGTTIYFDMESINSGINTQKDGTLNNIDKFVYNADAAELYYDENGKSPYTSEINRAIINNIDPNYIDIVFAETDFDKLSNEEKIKKILQNLTVKSDEFEGTQAINLKNMNLCEPAEVLSTPAAEDGLKSVIIEFGDDYTLGTQVQYTLYVKPGQLIHSNLILAKIIDNTGNEKFIKSQFGSGTVKGINNDTDYFHVYPSTCKRHIIIDNVTPGDAPIDMNDVSVYSLKMTKNSELYTLIVGHMVKSAYPIMLANCKRSEGTYTSNANECFSKYVNDYNSSISGYANDISAKMSNKDFIDENHKLINTSINIKDIKEKVNNLKDLILEIRNLIYNHSVMRFNAFLNQNEYFNYIAVSNGKTQTYKNNNNNYANICNKDKGDYLFDDCIGLALNTKLHSNDYKLNNKQGLFTKTAKNANYSNYYVSLLSSIDMNDECEFTKKYYNLISNIIANRLNKEANKYGLYELIGEFNSLYKVLSGISNGYKLLFNEFKNAFMQSTTNAYNDYKNDYDKVYTYIKRSIILYQTNGYNTIKTLDSSSLEDWYTAQSNDIIATKKDTEFLGACGQLANLFMFIKSLNPNTIVDKSSIKSISKTENYLTAFDAAFSSGISSNTKVLQSYGKKFKTYNELGIYVYKIFKSLTVQNFSSIHSNLQKIILLAYPSFNKSTTTTNINLEYLFSTWLKSYNKNAESNLKHKLYGIIVYLASNTTSIEIERYVQRMKNKFAYDLVCIEALQIKSFWKEIIVSYTSEYDLQNVINDLTNFANSFNKDALWPAPLELSIAGKGYDLYTFENKYVKDKNIDDLIINPSKMSQTLPTDATIDYEQIGDINPCDTTGITILDYEYWLVYMLNATLFTLIPLFWSDGFDIPPFMVPMLLPAIYLPIAPPIFIPIVNVVIVFGISLRGIWPMPIILVINLNSHDINVAFPIMIALELVKWAFQSGIKLLEGGIPAIIDGILNTFSADSAEMRKSLDKYRNFASILKSIPLNNKALIQKEFELILHEGEDLDLRQEITRTEKLGNGPEPL